MISTTDNYFNEIDNISKKIQKKIKYEARLTIGQFLENKNNILLNLYPNCDKQTYKNDNDELIYVIRPVYKQNDKLFVQTGNYIGKLKCDGIELDISSRFGVNFLNRMLNFVNNIYLSDIDIFCKQSDDRHNDFSKYILYYLFVQSLEKSFLIGFPKAYKNIKYHETKFNGRLDISRHIKRDIPFLGKVSSISRELTEIQEIIDVLHKAISIIDRYDNGNNALTKNIMHIKPHLRERNSNRYINKELINKAKNSKALSNPIYSSYKTVLHYAEYIIYLDSLQHSEQDTKQNYFGFLVNVADLFEIYMTKLLQLHFPDWEVFSPKINLYPNCFFSRKIIPDIVMQRGTDIMVFDTKYKRMDYKGNNQFGMGDVDRNDFFQIHTYMSFYQQSRFNLLGGGLLYPLSKAPIRDNHADNWLSNSKVSFLIDGVEVSDDKYSQIKQEELFIERIRKVL